MGDSSTGEGQPWASTEELLAGLDISPEGRAQASRKLDEARRRLTPDRVDALRAQVGLPRRR